MREGLADLVDLEHHEFESREVHLPLSWDDPATREAIDRYVHGVRADAPWCPWNIEFIRRMNGLESVEDVHRIVYDAEYLVLGLGDVYLGAPVATPLDLVVQDTFGKKLFFRFPIWPILFLSAMMAWRGLPRRSMAGNSSTSPATTTLA